VGDDGDVAKIFDRHAKGGQSAPDLEKEVQHYTAKMTNREKCVASLAGRAFR
jgi:hypothetical protein